MLTSENIRLYDLKAQLSLLPQFGHSKIWSSMPSSFGDRVRGLRAIHGGQSGCCPKQTGDPTSICLNGAGVYIEELRAH